jgi:hypothetical protein
LPSRGCARREDDGAVTEALGATDPIMPAPFPTPLLFKCRGHSGLRAQSNTSSASLFLLEHNPTMSSLGGPGIGGEGAPEKRRPGRPKGSGKKPVSRKRGHPLGSRNQKTLVALAAAAAAGPAVAASIGAALAVGGVDVPRKRGPGRPKGSKKKAATVAPSPGHHRGRPPGSKNKKTLVAFAATASGSGRPGVGASSLAGPSRLRPTLPSLQPPVYTSVEGWSTFIVLVLAGPEDRLRLPS